MLDTFFDPQAVAVIGASRTPGKLGYGVLHNILRHGYQGRVYAVNPKAVEIQGLPCYPSVLDLPGEIDLAVIVIPDEHVAGVLTECGQKRLKGAIVLAAGFRETGSAGRQRERAIVEIAQRYGMRLLGPNCLGIIDTVSSLNASFGMGMPRRGTIAFMSQSGALCTSILDTAVSDDVGFSRFVSLGNKADLDEIAFIDAWRDDGETRVIMAYLEEITRGVAFMQSARRASAIKPIVVVKPGATAAGSRAVSSHTGALAGYDRAYEAAFRQCGVIRAQSVQELFDYSIAFARQPLLPNDRIAVITNAGGPGVMAADACERAGLQLASLENDTQSLLLRALPVAASVLNPVDLLGDALAERYRLALEAVTQDANVGGILAILTPQAMTQVDETAHVVGRAAQDLDKPIFGCFMGHQAVQGGVRILNRYGVPNYPTPERAMAAMAVMMQYRRWRDRPPFSSPTFEVDRHRVTALLARARAEGRVVLGDVEASQFLEAYGIATPRSAIAQTANEAARMASEIGFPVALKVASVEVPHRTDVGGIRLNLATAAEVREAFQAMHYRVQRYVTGADIGGCLVQEMVEVGCELNVGVHRDPYFGPVVTVGLGGIYADALHGVAFRVAPFDRADARAMLAEIPGYNLLRGIRGQPPADLESASDALLRLSQLVVEHPDIAELDLSPLMVLEEGWGVLGIDMRLVLG